MRECAEWEGKLQDIVEQRADEVAQTDWDEALRACAALARAHGSDPTDNSPAACESPGTAGSGAGERGEGARYLPGTNGSASSMKAIPDAGAQHAFLSRRNAVLSAEDRSVADGGCKVGHLHSVFDGDVALSSGPAAAGAPDADSARQSAGGAKTIPQGEAAVPAQEPDVAIPGVQNKGRKRKSFHTETGPGGEVRIVPEGCTLADGFFRPKEDKVECHECGMSLAREGAKMAKHLRGHAKKTAGAARHVMAHEKRLERLLPKPDACAAPVGSRSRAPHGDLVRPVPGEGADPAQMTVLAQRMVLGFSEERLGAVRSASFFRAPAAPAPVPRGEEDEDPRKGKLRTGTFVRLLGGGYGIVLDAASHQQRTWYNIGILTGGVTTCTGPDAVGDFVVTRKEVLELKDVQPSDREFCYAPEAGAFRAGKPALPATDGETQGVPRTATPAPRTASGGEREGQPRAAALEDEVTRARLEGRRLEWEERSDVRAGKLPGVTDIYPMARWTRHARCLPGHAGREAVNLHGFSNAAVHVVLDVPRPAAFRARRLRCAWERSCRR